jgi:hypothetical protein
MIFDAIARFFASLLSGSGQKETLTVFRFTGSPSSWVSRGESHLLRPAAEDAYTFTLRPGKDGHVEISVCSSIFNMPSWDVAFAPPRGQKLEMREYGHATRYPFQDPINPGLSFSGYGRGCNGLTGSFRILEMKISKGFLQSFAADFVQFDEGHWESWNFGSIRFNSTVPLTLEQDRNCRTLFQIAQQTTITVEK